MEPGASIMEHNTRLRAIPESVFSTITSVGMPALLPDADKGMSLTKTSGGKLAIEINGTTIKNRSDRIKHRWKNRLDVGYIVGY